MGVRVKVAMVPSSRVRPSGLARATSRAARLVEAPGLWSMTKVPPSLSDRPWVTSRPTTSEAPPGAYGTTTATVCPAGQGA
jgi:hypothetical protein